MDAMDQTTEEFIPRNYQVELMRIALKQNTIIYLPTGSGKTFIAILVLKTMSGALTKSYNENGQMSVILVNSVALAAQHTKYVRDHTVLQVGCYTGDLNLDGWTKPEWVQEFNKYQVLVMTSQILLNLIHSNIIQWNRINLVIFDECHRGVDDHPMRQIMKTFKNIPVDQQPRVLGLTATLLNGNCKIRNIMDEVQSLEVTYHSKVATIDGLEQVAGYSTNPQERFEICQLKPRTLAQLQVLEIMNNVIKILSVCKLKSAPTIPIHNLPDNLEPLNYAHTFKDLINIVKDVITNMDLFGTFGAYKSCLIYLIQVQRIKIHCQEREMAICLDYVRSMLSRAQLIFLKEMAGVSDLEKIYKFSSEKVLKLLKILTEFKDNSKEELCALIFVQRRSTAKVLHFVLENVTKFCPTLGYIKSNYMVGSSNQPNVDTRESLYIAKKNKEVLDSFVNKDINVLVSSNILEEGVDIPKCTLVVKFDKSNEYRSYIQSKGRARHKASLYYTIVEDTEGVSFMTRYETFQEIEECLNNFLVGQNSQREGPRRGDINQMYYEEVVPPYYTNGPNSAQVNMLTSVSLLCHYCCCLSGNEQARHEPDWYIEKQDTSDKVRVVILLPIVSPIVDPIMGLFMSSKKLAKRAAALMACIQLHKCGELDDNLNPVRKELKEEDISFLFKHYPSKQEENAGFKKNKRLHDRQNSADVQGPIFANTMLYLHVIKLKPRYAPSEHFNDNVIYDLCTSNLCFGLISPNPLPELCKFPFFDSYGEMEVTLQVNVKTVSLGQEQIMHLREFHYLVFNDLLEVLKQFLVFDIEGSNSDMLLVVPVVDDGNVRIDFDCAIEHKTLKAKHIEPSVVERTSLNINEESYLYKIVSPWYRSQSSVYVVTKILTDKTPLSSFPNMDYTNFASYYEEKHSLKVYNLQHPLLQVKGLSKRLNAYKPRGIEAKRKKEKRYDELDEYLIAEFLVKQEFPACLWVQAKFLPSILSRVSFLLRLSELQTRIARDIGAFSPHLVACPPLELDPYVLKIRPQIQKALPLETPVVADGDMLALEFSSFVTQQYNKDYATKILEAEYPWKDIEEPKDLERTIDVTIMDIEYYEQFINKKASKDSRLLKNDSPLKRNNLLAIDNIPSEYVAKPLKVLSLNDPKRSPNLCQFYKALTAAEGNDIQNLERLETLGDSFLKLISSLYIYFKFPKYNEGQSSSLKGRLVSNKNLYYLGALKNIGGIMKNRDFSPREEWVPPCFTVPLSTRTAIENKKYSVTSLFYLNISPEDQITGTPSAEAFMDLNSTDYPITNDEDNSYNSMCEFLNKNYVGDKTVADAVEALLGAYFETGGFTGGVKFVEWIGIIPVEENVEKLIRVCQPDPIINKSAPLSQIDFHLPQWRNLETRLGYNFKNRAYLLQAVTHSSYSPNRITGSYENLEFLGDAILDFLITCYIYEYCGEHLDPGQVTDLRSALVNNNTFASLVVRCGFHKFLLLINTKLQGYIDKFDSYLAIKNYEIDDEVLILLEEPDLNIAEYVDVPKVLGDMFEALAGAVYLDSGKDLRTVWAVFHKIMWKEMELFSKNVPKNVIRRLYECPNAYPNFSKVQEVDGHRMMVALEFMCDGRKKRVHGFGTSKKTAHRAAAKIALRSLKM